MTAKELIARLQKEDPNSTIMMKRDEEGNGSPIRMWNYFKGFLGSIYRNPEDIDTIDARLMDPRYLEFYHEDEIKDEEKPFMLKAIVFEPM